MKKLLLSIFIGLCIISGAAAEEEAPCDDLVIRSLNASIPFELRKCKFNREYGNAGHDSVATGITFNYNRMTVSDGKDFGFSFMLGVGAGLNHLKLDTPIDDDLTLNGVSVDFKIGWGLAPVCRENIIFGVHAICCFNYKSLVNVYNNSDIELTEANFPLGIDFVLITRTSKSVSIFTGLDITSNIFGTGTFSTKNEYNSASLDYSTSGINATLRFGICWIVNDD